MVTEDGTITVTILIIKVVANMVERAAWVTDDRMPDKTMDEWTVASR